MSFHLNHPSIIRRREEWSRLYADILMLFQCGSAAKLSTQAAVSFYTDTSNLIHAEDNTFCLHLPQPLFRSKADEGQGLALQKTEARGAHNCSSAALPFWERAKSIPNGGRRGGAVQGTIMVTIRGYNIYSSDSKYIPTNRLSKAVLILLPSPDSACWSKHLQKWRRL